MADADRDSDLGDDSPVSARSEGESSGEQSCESSDEGVGRDAPVHQSIQHQVHQPLAHQPQHNMNHHTVNHQPISHQLNHHQRNSPRPLERELKVRDDFESLKSSLHPHLSSLASLAQGAPLSTPSSVFALAGGAATAGFPYAPPPFLAPAPPPPAQPAGSASSSSSEGSAAGWSFEEQYKQLYEISDDPQRKEFLDDLFSYMQKRGSPINRLPIMAKSVLDLYELYNLVIARGGLVEVINKKLWQEIIKGLRLPSSITSAAFTLRTQYMKYLYDYECDKKNLSTRQELEVAIEGNKREGRRSSGQYDAQAALAMPALRQNVVANSFANQLAQHPLSLSIAGMPRMPAMAQQIPPHEAEKVREYVKLVTNMALQQDLFKKAQALCPSAISPQEAGAGMISPRDLPFGTMDMNRIPLWSLYPHNNNNNSPHPDLEPQREALNLSDSPNSSGSVKREACDRTPPPPAKRRAPSSPPDASSSTLSERSTPNIPRACMPQTSQNGTPTNGVNGAAFKITTRGDASTGNQQLAVSIELNGVTYEGVLFPSQSGSGQNGHRQMVS